jgi:hypothetical protein
MQLPGFTIEQLLRLSHAYCEHVLISKTIFPCQKASDDEILEELH